MVKNVLFIHSSSELYGSDRSLLNIVKNINKDHYRVFVILPCEGPLVEEMKKIDGIKIEIFQVAVLRRKNLSIKGGVEYFREFFKSLKYLKKYIKNHNIDIVDTNTAVVFPGAIAAKQMKKKSIWHIREIIKSNLENRVISLMMQKYADLIIANSYSTGKALKVSQDKIRVIYNAVDEKNEIKKEKNERLVIGMAGRINRWKGQKLFVDAAEKIHMEYPDVIFKIAGEAYEGEEYLKEELTQYIREKNLDDTVYLLGQVNNMSLFYNSLDVFVLPSIQPEPFGLVVIEAMEFAVPVVATNHGGPTEIIQNGINGYLVDYHDCAEMVDAIKNLIENNEVREEMGRKGKEIKRERYSVSTMVTGVENVFKEVLR